MSRITTFCPHRQSSAEAGQHTWSMTFCQEKRGLEKTPEALEPMDVAEGTWR